MRTGAFFAGPATRGLLPAARPSSKHEAYVKRISSGFLCLVLLLVSGVRGRAQQPQVTPPQGPEGPQRPAPPPLPPQPPDVKLQDEGKISIGPYAWFPSWQPIFDKGKKTGSDQPSRVDFQRKMKLARGLVLSVPAGGHNAIRVSFFDNKAAGNVTASTALNLWSSGFNAGDYLATHYNLRNVKVSYEYLTWPYPVGSRRFRLKTLWQVQYVHIGSTFNAPLSDNPLNIGAGTKTVILPTLGIGITHYASDHFRIEANASGFTIPHHSALGDVDGTAAYKFGRLELRGGVRGFYFKTSPQSDFYLRGRLIGGFVGLRLYWN
ncbi:MAG: hypothetical protein C5B51_31495 [Terriglobia bacterium]|nr:MAG: hypothetical protein C5B51_31495 [Terriglobia bacterium]